MRCANKRKSFKKKVSNAVEKMSDSIAVWRNIKNEFGDNVGVERVVEVVGQYYHGGKFHGKNAYASVILSDGGRTTKNQSDKFMTIIDENSSKIRVGDCFMCKGYKFEITELGNNLDVYFDFSLERI